MKKLSDYKGEEAIELWVDLLDPMTEILGDPEVQKSLMSNQPKITMAKDILKLHKQEAIDIMLRIDPEPIDGVNILLRLMSVIVEFRQNAEMQSFFGSAAQEKTNSESSGSATESTGVVEN